MSELIRHTAAELATALADGSASSVEVTKAHLDRIAAVDGAVHAFLHVNPEVSLAAAAASVAAAVAGAAERAVLDSRLTMAAEKFPDLQVQMDGMEKPMPMAEFLAAAKAEADDLAAEIVDQEDAVQRLHVQRRLVEVGGTVVSQVELIERQFAADDDERPLTWYPAGV